MLCVFLQYEDYDVGSPDMNGHLVFTYMQHKPSVPTSQRTNFLPARKLNHLKLFWVNNHICSDHLKE